MKCSCALRVLCARQACSIRSISSQRMPTYTSRACTCVYLIGCGSATVVVVARLACRACVCLELHIPQSTRLPQTRCHLFLFDLSYCTSPPYVVDFVVSQVAALDKGPDRVLRPLPSIAASERRCVLVRWLVARCYISQWMIGPPTGTK